MNHFALHPVTTGRASAGRSFATAFRGVRLLVPLSLGLLVLAPLLPAQETNEETERPAKRSRNEFGRTPHKELVAVGHDVTVSEGDAAREVVAVLGDAIIDGAVRRDLVVVGGTAKLGPNAEVGGDLVVVGGTVRLGPKADVRGDLVVVGGSLDADPTAHIDGSRIVIGNDSGRPSRPALQALGQWIQFGLFRGRPLPHQLMGSWVIAAIALLLYFVIAVLFPRQVQASVTVLEEKPGEALLVGLLGLLLTVPLLFLVAITVVGIPVIPFAIGGWFLAFVFGRVAVYRYAGQQIGAQFGLTALRAPLVALLIGALTFCLLYTVPILGFVVWGAVAPLGLGAVILAVLKRAHPAAVEPVGVVLPPADAGATPPVLLPRVGFWMRLLATLLDFVLIALIVGPVLHRPKLFLPLWIVYHLALWSWKGTTLGGIVLGLKIVRLDGSPVNFAVALVRTLGGFFSAAVFGLGFFWAGWSADRQSWHDKIAGTLVVKFPKGTPLI